LAVISVSTVCRLLTSKENFIVHPSLNYKKTRRYKRFFEKLCLEHFNQVFDPKLLRLLRILSLLHLQTKCIFLRGLIFNWRRLSLKLCQLRLLLEQSNLSAFFQSKLRIFAVNTFEVNHVTTQLYF
jgi:hypothetical protein